MFDKPLIEETVDQGLAGAQETLLRSLTRLLNGDSTVIAEVVVAYLVPATVALLAVFVGYLIAKYTSRTISGPICNRVDETLGKFIGRIVFYGVLLAVMGGVLTQVGIKMTGLATILAAAGFAIGLAFQGTLSNFAAGVLLLVFRPFKVGDMVNAAGVMGRVNEIDLFTTTLDTPDNRRIIVPNSSISGGTIENVSYHKHRRVEVVVGVAYSSSIDATRQALTAAAESIHSQIVHGEGRGYTVQLAGLADSSVQWRVRAWAATPEFFAVTEALTQAVKQQLDAANISIPFPQMDVHLFRQDEAQESSQPTLLRPRMSTIARQVTRDAA